MNPTGANVMEAALSERYATLRSSIVTGAETALASVTVLIICPAAAGGLTTMSLQVISGGVGASSPNKSALAAAMPYATYGCLPDGSPADDSCSSTIVGAVDGSRPAKLPVASAEADDKVYSDGMEAKLIDGESTVTTTLFDVFFATIASPSHVEHVTATWTSPPLARPVPLRLKFAGMVAQPLVVGTRCDNGPYMVHMVFAGGPDAPPATATAHTHAVTVDVVAHTATATFVASGRKTGGNAKVVRTVPWGTSVTVKAASEC
jgi:hypothetical protein